MHRTIIHALAEARHAGQRRQAQRDELACAARRARRAPRQRSTRLAPGLLTIVTCWADRGGRATPALVQAAGCRSQHGRAAR
jgi:hypothetical protein